MRKYIEFEIAKKYLHEACAFIGGNGGMMLKIKFDEEPTIELPPTDIEKLPSAQSEQQWIPCSERLPNTNGCYLVWRPHFFGGEIGMPSICYFDGSDTWHDSYGVDFTRILNKDDVTAWMPLPEPWRGVKG